MPKTKQKTASRDSLAILDSLVTKNKIRNTLLAKQFAKRALVIARGMKSDTAQAEAYKLLGIAYFPDAKDSSYYYFTSAIKIADSANLLNVKIPVIYNLAMLYSAAYNYNGAITLLDSSVRMATSVNDFKGMSRAFIALGNLKLKINDVEHARQMYESALVVARKNKLNEQVGVALGNLAKFELEKDTLKALSIQRDALVFLQKEKGTEEEMATILINMGNRFSNPDSALYYYKSALDLAVNANLSKIQFGAYNNMAYSYLDQNNVRMAESCLRELAIPLAIKENDHDWLSSLYDTYADVCVKLKDYRKAHEMRQKALTEKKKDYRQKGAEQLRLLAALLELKNKELTIKNGEKELLLQRNRLQKTELWLVISLSLVALSLFITFVLQQRNRIRLHQEQINSARRIIEMDETEKGRTARELHDLTGQLVLGVYGTVENIEFPDLKIKEHIQSRIKELGESLRQISHRMNRAMIEPFTFSELITGMCVDFNRLSGMSVELDMPGHFSDLPNELVLHFYRITQELLTNAGKYAHDSQVNIRIWENNGHLFLYYTDNGIGFIPDEKSRSSMGISNVFERSKLFNGKAILNSAPGKGTRWEISFPVFQKNTITN